MSSARKRRFGSSMIQVVGVTTGGAMYKAICGFSASGTKTSSEANPVLGALSVALPPTHATPATGLRFLEQGFGR